MHGDDIKPDPTGEPDAGAIDPVTAHLDRDGLKQAHGRTGRLLKNAGLPFEEEEFDERELTVTEREDDDETSASSDNSAEQ